MGMQSTLPFDMDLKKGTKQLQSLTGSKMEEGIYVAHSGSKLWFHCYIAGSGRDAEMRCVPMDMIDEPNCGFRVCNHDRQTFQTVCLSKPGALPFTGSND